MFRRLLYALLISRHGSQREEPEAWILLHENRGVVLVCIAQLQLIDEKYELIIYNQKGL